MPECTYRDLIKEAYIDPIRSVLIVDDDYPTLEELFEQNGATTNTAISAKQWRTKPDRFKEVVDKLRQRKWLVDTHDGRNIRASDEDGFALHLHQSDLLILDYQLEGDGRGGEKCLSVIQRLVANDHFNLVVVYTQNEKPAEVFQKIVLNMLSPCPHLVDKLSNVTQIEQDIELWEDTDTSIRAKLLNSLDLGLYLSVRQDLRACLSEIHQGEGGRFHQFVSLYINRPDRVKVAKVQLFYWVIQQKEQEWRSLLSGARTTDCEWSVESTGNPWVRTNKLFLTVVSKDLERDLPKALLDALDKWAPPPSRLILSKIRDRIEDLGVSAEDSLLHNRTQLQAGWYKGLLDASKEELATKTETTISRYWDGLICSLNDGVKDYVQKLIALEHKDNGPSDGIVLQRFNYDISDPQKFQKALLHQNAYNCSKSPGGWHLTTGHVLKLDEDFWVCLSPACDLVPDQKSEKGRYKKLHPALPFHAMRLFPCSDEAKALENATENRYIFLDVDGRIQTLCSVGNEDDNTNPTWEEMFAQNQGRFAEGSAKDLQIGRCSWCLETRGIKTEWKTVPIIGQLRYEYALNLLQRHGSALCRIGLGFVGLPQLVSRSGPIQESASSAVRSPRETH